MMKPGGQQARQGVWPSLHSSLES